MNNFAIRLELVSKIMEGKAIVPEKLKKSVTEYHDISTKATTNSERRIRRQEILKEAIDAAEPPNEQAAA